jgi:hypothetical protein
VHRLSAVDVRSREEELMTAAARLLAAKRAHRED